MLDKALIREIGNIKEKDNLLLKALLYVVTHSLQKKSSVKTTVKKSAKRTTYREYDLQDAFNDAFKRKGSRLPKYSSLANTLIPKPM